MDSLTWKIWNKFSKYIFNILKINFINCITLPLKHIFEGWKHRFFIFYYWIEVLLDEIITWYIFLDSLTWKLWNKFVTDIFDVLKINFINWITWSLKPNITWHDHFNIILKTTLEGYLNIVDFTITTLYTLMTKMITSPTEWCTSITSWISSLLYH